MKQEKLMHALTDVGDDLLEMANHRRFPNHWKKWGRTAACLALVLCLTAVALPYFPMGCGSSASMSENAVSGETKEEAIQDGVYDSQEDVAETPATAPEATEKETETVEDQETVEILVDGQWYACTGELLTQTPEDLGAALGTVEETTDPELMECLMYASGVQDRIYVKTDEGYWAFTAIS